MKYISTRGNGGRLTASEAILQGIGKDGGLYVPEEFPVLDKPLGELLCLPYRDLAYEILKLFLTDYTGEELRYCVEQAYDDKFDTAQVAPLVTVGDSHFLELFHGQTIAFKDMALSILPHLLTTAAKKNHMEKEIVILTATSGDTGKAALAGFANVPGARVVVFFPEDGVSPVQKKQMTTQEGENTFVVGIRGNFDDAQTGVKKMFRDAALKERLLQHGFVFSSANSINIGRLVPQVVYYFYAYGQLLRKGVIEKGQQINFTVPTGNFGNILAGYYAKKLGLPIGKLICASNDNKVLFDFFRTGEYNKNREFILTASPSMDILISSNLERFLYHQANDPGKIVELMEALSRGGVYRFPVGEKDILGYYAGQEESFDAIRRVFQKGYTMDTHTAVAYRAWEKYRDETGDDTPNVIVSTASPFKFTVEVCAALDPATKGQDPFGLIERLSQMANLPVPPAVDGLASKPVLHRSVCAQDEMEQVVRGFLGINE